MIIEIIREDEPGVKHNYGQMLIDGAYFGETLEDKDRYLETGGEKVDGDTAIPRGSYPVTLSMSKRFGRIMPEVHDVQGFSGVRIHGGNTEANTEGCPLLGSVRTDRGIANCAGINERLRDRIGEAIADHEEVTLEVK